MVAEGEEGRTFEASLPGKMGELRESSKDTVRCLSAFVSVRDQ